MTTSHTNRLRTETSPYLLQHAHNPVDWYPWCFEALEKARVENKPILLSIGYSACHWCHVMERESFENEAIAALMNTHFINIKVDREERPDLDQIYQQAGQLLTGQGGWPLTMFLTPDQQPFYGGTYFPPDDRYGRPGFARVLRSVADAYHQRQADVARSVQQLQDALQRLAHFEERGAALAPEVMEQATQTLAGGIDTVHGGFGTQPKFPNPVNLEVLLRSWRSGGNAHHLSLVLLTLEKMAWGGIYDHLGGGFHRYAVDNRWLVPHFEKMLYDNAQLLPLYLAAYQITKTPLFARVAQEILVYLRREMRHPEGGFYATQDADSEGEEGRFYVWTKADTDALLGDNARLFCRYYDVTEVGNWEHGKNILHLTISLEQLAALFDRDLDDVAASIDTSKATLLTARAQRSRPFRDEKILTAWNGLAISALVQAANVLGDHEALRAARDTLAFLQHHLWRDGALLRTYKDGQAKHNGYLDDYAFLAAALLDTFEATGEPAYFEQAVELTETMLAEFWDEAQGGFFYTGKRHEPLIHRPKSAYDEAIPSGTAVATRTLLRLAHYSGRQDYRQRAERVLRIFQPYMAQQPFSFGGLLTALDVYLQQPHDIVLLGSRHTPQAQALWQAVHHHYVPNKTLLHLEPRHLDTALQHLPHLRDTLAGKRQVGGQATVYVCHNFTCSLPITDPEALVALLGKTAGDTTDTTDRSLPTWNGRLGKRG